MNFAQITIYDIVGYFMPGTFGLIGLYLLTCPWMSTLEKNWTQMTIVKWLFVGLCAYVLGHCIQGVANWVESIRGWPRRKQSRQSSIATILGSCNQQYAEATAWVRRHLGLTDVDSSVLYEIMDAHVIQRGKTETRDIYVYREGFYRGLYVAFALVAAGAVVRLVDRTTYTLFAGRVVLDQSLLWMAALINFVAAVLCYKRFRRFEGYRIKFALMSFVALTAEESRTPEQGVVNKK